MVPAGHHGGFIHRMNGPLSAPWWAFQELGHTQGLLCTFFIACALCIWELFAMAKILQDPVFSRLCTSCRVEILGRKRKKKSLGLFQLCKLLPEASNCCKKYTQIFRLKFNQIPRHWDLFKCQQPEACLLISDPSTSANVFCFTEIQSQT